MFLETCVYSVTQATQNIDAEIIVADNASTDGSVDQIQRNFPEVKIHRYDKNHGFSKGNNLAVEQARGEYLCILNPDTIVGENVFKHCIAFAKAYKSPKTLGFIGCRLIDGSGSFLKESKRHIPTPKVARKKMMGDSDAYYFSELDAENTGEVEILVGAFMFCKKDVYEDCNGFDERYFMYGEDIDLSYTALNLGYQNIYLGDQIVLHFKGESTVRDRKNNERFYGAMKLFYEKHFKNNFLESWGISLAVQALSLFAKRSNAQIKTEMVSAKTVLISKRSLSNSEFDLQSESTEDLALHQPTIIAWDLQTISISEILMFMSQHPNKYLYRFLTTNDTAMIGSDHSESKGVVVQLS